MAERLIIDNQTIVCADEARVQPREWRRFTLNGTSAQALALLVPGSTYYREWDSMIFDGQGNPQGTEVLTENLDDYAIIGDVIDHRNGTATVYLGKKTEAEIYQETIDALMLELLM